MDAQLFLEPADRRLAQGADRALDLAQASQQAIDQTVDDHVAELGEAGRQLDAQVVQHCRKGLVDQPDRAEVGQHGENPADASTEAGADFGPGAGEVFLDLVPVSVNEVRAACEYGDNSSNG